MERWQQLIAQLELTPHPEGGFYRETFRSPTEVATASGPRAASTAIYFLLPPGRFSAWHRVSSDEVWHLYEGELELHTLHENGPGMRVLDQGEPQAVVPAGVWQAARPRGYALCGCTVAPGFDFADFEMPDRATLRALFPAHTGAVDALSR